MQPRPQPSTLQEPDPAGSYTAADYLSWTFEGYAELIRGRLFRMSPAPSSGHQWVSSRLLEAFFAAFSRTGCRVFHAPFDVYLVHRGEDYKAAANVVQPDICVVCDRQKLRKAGCVGAPDLVVEILSPSSIRKDTADKFSLYQEYGVPEFWMVHPYEGTVTVNVLENGAYRTLRPHARGEVLQSVLFPGLRVSLDAVFDQPEFED